MTRMQAMQVFEYVDEDRLLDHSLTAEEMAEMEIIFQYSHLKSETKNDTNWRLICLM
jgi:hypothetical protein